VSVEETNLKQVYSRSVSMSVSLVEVNINHVYSRSGFVYVWVYVFDCGGS